MLYLIFSSLTDLLYKQSSLSVNHPSGICCVFFKFSSVNCVIYSICTGRLELESAGSQSGKCR